MPKMTDAEWRCFWVASRWYRRQLIVQWWRALFPRLPFKHLIKEATFLARLIYCLLVVLLLPLLVIKCLVNFVFLGLLLPFRLIASRFSPSSLRPPGERNIQGVHNAFAKYFELAPKYYIRCVDSWVNILYGERVSLRHPFRSFIDQNMIDAFRTLDHDVDRHAMHVFADAREQMARTLGSYR